MSAAQISVPQVVSRKLYAVRGRRRLLAVLAGTALAAAVFCGLLLVAMLLDWLITPFESAPRVALTAAVLLAGTAAWIHWGLRPALSRASLPMVAELVDSAVPELEERWTTIADLSQTSDPPEIRGSTAMIGQVAREAENLDDLVRPRQIVSGRTVGRNLWAFGGMLAVLAIVWVVDAEQTRVLWQRFWSPTQPISLTQVTSPSAGAVVPRHEPVDIVAALNGRVRDSSTIWMRDAAGAVTTHAMTASTTSPAEFLYQVDDVGAPLEYRIRSGDGQTPWHRIDVADRPRLTGIQFTITPPAYSRLPVVQQAGLPRRTRVLEGSTIEVTFTASEPLREMSLELADDSSVKMAKSAEGKYRFEQVLTDDLSFTPRLVSEHGLTNEQPPSCHLVVYRDQFPSVAIVSPESDYVVRPDDEIQIEFTASDDFGIARAELVITDATHPADAPLKLVEIPLDDQQNQADIRGSVPLNLQEFDLQNGATLSYSVRVFDTKDSTAESRHSASSSTAQQSDANGEPSDSSNTADTETLPNQSEPQPADPNQVAMSEVAQQDSEPQASSKPAASQSPSSSSPGSKAAANTNSDDQQPTARQEGAPRPADHMQRRQMLGQCSSCRPMNLKIDEWAGSFAGQQREKLELAIDAFLARMETALRDAEQQNQTVFDEVAGGAAWMAEHVVGARQAAGNLAVASDVAVELATTSAGTPYAFMGLQLVEIDERHVVPAQSLLQGVDQTPESERQASLQSSLFHIHRARELLAGLSRTYEGVKINHQIAEAMTHVKQMHQVFIEDTFQLLGESRPVLNPKQRKFLELELDEEFRNKLKALLEKKRDVQAELAKVLAENPELLRRFMAQARIDADSLRDQMTLLANRQAELRQETASLLQSPDDAGAVLVSRRARQARDAVEIAQTASLMFENFETWLPKDLQRTDAAVVPIHQLYQQLAATADQFAATAITGPVDPAVQAANGASTEIPQPDSIDLQPAVGSTTDVDNIDPVPASPNHGQRLYELLYQLQDELPKLTEGRPGHSKLTTHVVNRLAEVGKLTTSVSGWLKKEEAFAQQDHDLIAQIEQTDLTNDTAELTIKIANQQSFLSGLTDEIVVLSDELVEILEGELLVRQATAEEAFAEHVPDDADRQQALAVESFARGESQFDRLLDAIIAHLDSLPASTTPSLDGADGPSLEELLAMLESEKFAVEGLGIPCCRPNNLSIVKDWLKPGKGGGMGATMAAGALAQTMTAQQRAGRLQKTAEERQRRLLAEMEAAARQQAGRGRAVNPRWNTLQSRLDDSLKQVRGQEPPPKYRSAIELYFELISGVSPRETQE